MNAAQKKLLLAQADALRAQADLLTALAQGDDTSDAPAPVAEPTWLSIPETKKRFGVAPTRLRAAAHAGEIVAARVDRKLVLSVASVAAYVEARQLAPVPVSAVVVAADDSGDELDRRLAKGRKR